MATTTSEIENKTASPVTVEIRDGIAVVRVENPPVNAISKAVRSGLLDAFEKLAADRSVKGIVLTASGRTFMAGADIREFDAPAEPPLLPDVIAAIEAVKQPTAAAIFGTALGGGFECALACHMRVMAHDGRIGLPEVKLGIIPGAGGTQRTLRLAGFEAAADLVTSGRMVGAQEALELKLADHIAERDPLEAAIALIGQKLETNDLPPHASERDAAPVSDGAIENLRAAVTKTARGAEAPVRAFDLLVETAGLPFEEGVARERQLFLELRESDQARALRHVFLAERAAARPPQLETAKPRSVSHIGVIGGGLMGTGIAFAALLSGYRITVIEQDDAAVTRTRERFDELFAGAIKRGKLDDERRAAREAQLELVQDFQALAPADLVIEAVFEDMEVKREIFARLDGIVRPDAILASNTSYLNINAIADTLSDPTRMLGLHFFSPAHVMRLLEVVKCEHTSDDALATGLAVGRKLGKVPVITGVCDGFCGNRILKAYRMVAEFLVEDGALPQDIDGAMTKFGFAMGPFAVQDMAGLEIAYANRKQDADQTDDGRRRPALLERLVEAGRLGQKNGKGWYRYEPGSRSGQPDPEVEAIIRSAKKKSAATSGPPDQDEIERRLLAAIINEGARILQEGIVMRASDVDLVMVHGYGFPRHKGGPMFLAEQIGNQQVLNDAQALHKAYGDGWEPAG